MSQPSTASIDDLLGHEEESLPAAQPTRRGLGWLVRTVFWAAVLAGVAVLAAQSAELVLPYPLAFAGAFALLALRRIVGLVAVGPHRTVATAPRGEEDGEYHWGTRDGLRLAVNRWAIRLDWGHTDFNRSARVLQPALAEIADERLRQRHGVTLAGDPERARALVGEPLWTFLVTPVQRPITPRHMAALVDRLERI